MSSIVRSAHAACTPLTCTFLLTSPVWCAHFGMKQVTWLRPYLLSLLPPWLVRNSPCTLHTSKPQLASGSNRHVYCTHANYPSTRISSASRPPPSLTTIATACTWIHMSHLSKASQSTSSGRLCVEVSCANYLGCWQGGNYRYPTRSVFYGSIWAPHRPLVQLFLLC